MKEPLKLLSPIFTFENNVATKNFKLHMWLALYFCYTVADHDFRWGNLTL